ncbi:hypothetical protein TWF106_006595 [Orbilia oligospora]|uniref:6-methylsalicylic acid synthase n=1 Tax=Orbilia oligospora TaxID=2813651 RepID=A0A6G1LZ74_ORBOL|nr:hypothetical protein TWF191_003449 [Orbilia oligospora]KAF3210525.1 hypothetical protein TWF679_006727 [Orbilia oligospora]KAF3220999.1 hypothetical protein TWF106_006595 [Orbilia oligospora]KAF3239532.1 hypothetical protein TWF192_009999 [Orbilia oligospora]
MTSTPATSLGDMDHEYNQDDIAIIGMACRLAGGIQSIEQFWNAILSKKDASGEIPEMRWEPYFRRDSRNAEILKKTTSRGYFLDRLENFDASFFGISPLEAELMDPQQRIALEVTWEALEHAGISVTSLAGSDTAVFMGVNSDDYSRLLLEDVPGVEAWMGIGTAFCGIPNRISYTLDLHGPSTAVDAACASGLVAVHHGRQALLAGESKLAIVGGVNALIGPGLTRVLDEAGAVTPEGRCRSFDDSASGYGRGEGASVLVLKRLSEAIIDGDKVLAVLKGSAVGQDGKTNGIMSPNQVAQEEVARKALSVARVDPLSVAFVEAHATSTPVGDPCEVAAIASVYGSGAGRPKDLPCKIGSVKPNVGHLEAGAGSTSLIKAVLAVSNGIFPPQANFQTPNRKMDWDNNSLEVVRDVSDWVQDRKRAGICSYGYGGTVAHAVIEQAPAPNFGPENQVGDVVYADAAPYLLFWSAPQSQRLRETAAQLASWVGETDQPLADIANTLAYRRSQHQHRCAVVADNREEAVKLLELGSQNADSPWMIKEKVSNYGKKGAVWVFSGHGAHWTDMGKELLASEPAFYGAVSSIDNIVRDILNFSPLEALENGDLKTTDKQQVLTYAMQVGLSAVLRSKGAQPAAVIGHSVGEIAASVTAGCLTIQEGAFIVSQRAKLYRLVAGRGAMILVDLSPEDAVKELEEQGQTGAVAVAIHSSPNTCVLSGSIEAINGLEQSLKDKHIQARRVKTDVAFHSPVLNELAEPLLELISGHIKPQQPTIRLYSTSLTQARGDNLRDEKYWIDNMIQPVLLTNAVKAALEDDFGIFLEVSSHPIIAHSINETIIEADSDGVIFPTLRRDKPSRKCILFALGKLHCHGAPIDLRANFSGDWTRDVPTTVWKHNPFWRKVGTGSLQPNKSVTHDVKSHVLLGAKHQVVGSDTTMWTTTLDESTRPFPGSHPLHGTEIVPAAVLLNTFLHTGEEYNALKDVILRVPVAMSAPRNIQIVKEQGRVRIVSRLQASEGENNSAESSWLTHTTGHVAKNEWSKSSLDISATKKKLPSVKPSFATDYLASVGVPDMGFPWKVTEHYGEGDEMLSRVDTAPESSEKSIPWDLSSWAPILDAATSIGSSIFYKEPVLRMPAQIDEVAITPGSIPKVAYIHTTVETGMWRVNVAILNEEGHEVAHINGMRFSAVEGTPGASGSVESLVHQMSWPPAKLEEEGFQLKNVVFVSEQSDRVAGYIQDLQKRKVSATVVPNPTGLEEQNLSSEGTIVVYLPSGSDLEADTAKFSSTFCSEVLDITKLLVNQKSPSKLWCITHGLFEAFSPSSLSQGPLVGLSRIIASEHPEIWGGLVDTDDESFPLQAVKYVKSVDVISVRDSVARVARLRPVPRSKIITGREKTFTPTAEGTYLITGGLGALGLETAKWMVESGARRLILVSRRGLPPRRTWVDSNDDSAISTIRKLERLGASIHVVAADISKLDGAERLEQALDLLDLPRVSGVVHAAGVLEDQLVAETTKESFDRVLAPKVSGAMALHQLFPPKTLEFFVLFSSCGQLLGFPGQASYASGNAFLDTFADFRRNQGDNIVSFLWTSWNGLGMASSTEYINAELEAKGITSVSRDEAFRAWEHAIKHDIHQAVVLRALPVEENGIPPLPILDEIAPRKRAESNGTEAVSKGEASEKAPVPKSGPELKEYLQNAISECVAKTLRLPSAADVDPSTALTEMGMDSVMTVSLRKHLQTSLKVTVPPTLIWGHPTVNHLVKWFEEKI